MSRVKRVGFSDSEYFSINLVWFCKGLLVGVGGGLFVIGDIVNDYLYSNFIECFDVSGFWWLCVGIF